MKHTNNFLIPEHMARAIIRRNEKYSMGGADYSATGLLKPAHMAALQREHRDELQEDVSDMFWRVWGQTAHDLFADGHEDALQEVRFFIEIDGKKISGQADVITRDGCLIDTKTTSSAALSFGDVSCPAVGVDRQYRISADWIAQVNIYRYLATHGWCEMPEGTSIGDTVPEITSLAISVAVRDWTKSKTAYDSKYPHAPAFDISVPVWTDDETLSFIRARMAAHNEPAPDCEPSERWARNPCWTLTIDGKRYLNGKRFFTEEDAIIAQAERIAAGKKNVEIIFHEPESVRCGGYCGVCEWCEPHKARESAKANKGSENADE